MSGGQRTEGTNKVEWRLSHVEFSTDKDDTNLASVWDRFVAGLRGENEGESGDDEGDNEGEGG